MAKEDYKKTGFYSGADYGFDPNYGKEFSLGLDSEYRFSPGEFGFPSDPTTANQLVAVSKKLNTGAKTIEVSGINIMGGGPGGLMEKIPDQHLKEINRLKELTGVDLTFHGPLVEASGWGEGGWNEVARAGAERQMWNAVDRAHTLEPNGNLIITFHSTAGVPELIQKEMTKDGPKVTEIIAFDERDPTRPARIRPKENILLNEKGDAYKELENINKQTWFNQMAQLTFNTKRGLDAIEDPLERLRRREGEGMNTKEILDLYHKSKTDKNWQDFFNSGANPFRA